ncbi:MAG: long-chain fatty acid--CoA ligase [Gemmataceae bacterium]|nr:long-chain fatty acid--CoA ligase [Gemmataceae bacterium]
MGHRNLADLHRRQADRLGARIAVRFKRHGLYHDLSFADYHNHALACAAALVEAGIRPGDRIGLLGENSVEWLIADMGLLAAGAVNVPPHAPLSARQIHYQLADAGCRWLFVSNAGQLAKVRQVRAELPDLLGVVVFDRGAAGPDAFSWAGFLQRGRAALPRLRAEVEERSGAVGPDDLATIMYTSGTTGNPKGVMLTHGNLLSNAIACDQAAPRGADAVLLCWLPFSHIYARTVDHYLSLVAGVPLCLAESAETVVENLREIEPTHLSCVPRFHEKLLAAVGCPDPQEQGRRLRAVFGPRIDWLGSGGAALPVAVAQVFEAAGLLVLQGYGLTESSPVISFNRKAHYKLASVGQPIPGVEVEIAPDGEVLTRGPHVMKGYWNNPQATADAIRDGWLYTGDLGSLDEEGFLTITGRKKELLVLSNGKKVVPTYLEGLLLADDCIDQAVIHGEGRNFLTALVVPHWDNVRRLLPGQEARGGGDGKAADGASSGAPGSWPLAPPEELARHPAVVDLLRRRIEAALADVAGWEQVRKFVVLPRPFTVAAEELTVSLKLRRSVVFSRYRTELEALYQE